MAGATNLNKARIKILVKTLGIERFREQVEAEWQLGRASAARLPAEEVARVRSFFRPQPYLATRGLRRQRRARARLPGLVSLQHPSAPHERVSRGVRVAQGPRTEPGGHEL